MYKYIVVKCAVFMSCGYYKGLNKNNDLQFNSRSLAIMLAIYDFLFVFYCKYGFI